MAMPCSWRPDRPKTGQDGRQNATGCDILIVDAEGADCAIVNGMITMCQKGFSNWPTLLRYETRAENYDLYGRPAEGGANPEEENMIVTLQKEGYLVLEVGGDATLIYGPNLTPSDRCLGEWANYHYSLTCCVCNKRVAPWPDTMAFGKDVERGSNQWRGTKKDQEIVRWDTSIVQLVVGYNEKYATGAAGLQPIVQDIR